jgi:hypothetical protein
MANYDIGTATGATNEEIATAIKGVVDSGLSSSQIADALVNGGGGITLSVSGVPAVGNDLTAVLPSEYGATSYQWMRDGVDISGATSSTYTLVSADSGTQITVKAVGVYVVSSGVSVEDVVSPDLYVEFNDGAYATFPEARFNGDFTISFTASPTEVEQGVLIGNATTSFILALTTGVIRSRFGTVTIDSSAGVFDFYNTNEIVYSRVSGVLTATCNSVEFISSVAFADTVSLSRVACYGAGSLPFSGFIYDISLDGITYITYSGSSEAWSMIGTDNVSRTGSILGKEMTLAGVDLEDIKESKSPLQATDFNVIVLAGQSNMVGRAPIEVGVDDDYSEITSNVFQYGYDSGEITVATNPLDHADEWPSTTGVWLEFVKSVQSSMPDKPILLIPVAKGGTGLVTNQWNKGDQYYEAAVTRINAVMANAGNTLKGIVWMMGENDADSENDTYLADFTTMWSNMKSDCSISDSVPVLLSTISLNNVPTYGPIINADINSFSNSLINSAVVDTTDLDLLDEWHYTAAGLRTIGQRLGAAYLEL